MSDESFSEEDAYTLQKIGFSLDSLRQKGFADSSILGEQVWVLAKLAGGVCHLEEPASTECETPRGNYGR